MTRARGPKRRRAQTTTTTPDTAVVEPGSKLEKKHWGKAGWDFLQAVTFLYPQEDQPEDSRARQTHAALFRTLGNTLPCLECRAHWRKALREHPPNLLNRQTLVRWIFERHNAVNARLGKKQYPWIQFLVDYVEPDSLDRWLSGTELAEAEALVEDWATAHGSSSSTALLRTDSATDSTGKNEDQDSKLRNYKITVYFLGFLLLGTWIAWLATRKKTRQRWETRGVQLATRR